MGRREEEMSIQEYIDVYESHNGRIVSEDGKLDMSLIREPCRSCRNMVLAWSAWHMKYHNRAYKPTIMDCSCRLSHINRDLPESQRGRYGGCYNIFDENYNCKYYEAKE